MSRERLTTMMEIRQTSVDVDGTEVFYCECGADTGAPPLLLLHGGGPGADGLSNYRRNIEELAQSVGRVIAPDMPAFGKTANRIPPGPGTGLMGALADVTIGFMDALGIEQADFVGNSMGGGQCLSIALRFPERIRRMVLMGPGGFIATQTPIPTEGQRVMSQYYFGDGPSPEKMRAVLELLVYDRSFIDDDLVAQRVKAASRPDVVADPPWPRYGLDPLWKEDLASIQTETLIMWGKEDRVNPVDGAQFFSKVLQNSELHLFPKCGHWVQFEQAPAFNRLVSEFLTR